ncbi:MAG: dethiobiotin synthase [Rickettsiales bacterium]|nr:dethiobiotin synthase [Rickettsiales bacterium]
MTKLFITATGTGIGKTCLTSALTWQLRQQGRHPTALKPIISGYTGHDPETDTARILHALGKPLDPHHAALISPWRFTAPLSPNMAALREGRSLHLPEIVTFCQKAAAIATGPVLVEGVGGVLAPLTMRETVADWMQALNWPVVLVAGSYLGTLSHTLTAAESLKTRGLHLHAVALSESADSPVPLAETAATLEAFLPEMFAGRRVPVLKIPRVSNASDWAAWPDLSELCAS